ncbi:MAG TPA: hypothetical protein VFV38_16100 [Ktedonobacteraceae bacterium]|nr:hypothetical protein [Ktedonobacteraceae bacterium]
MAIYPEHGSAIFLAVPCTITEVLVISLVIPQIYLEKSVEEILQQLSALYANDLSHYHIQLQF